MTRYPSIAAFTTRAFTQPLKTPAAVYDTLALPCASKDLIVRALDPPRIQYLYRWLPDVGASEGVKAKA